MQTNDPTPQHRAGRSGGGMSEWTDERIAKAREYAEDAFCALASASTSLGQVLHKNNEVMDLIDEFVRLRDENIALTEERKS